MKMGRPEGWKAVAEDLLVLGLPRAHGGRSMMVLLGGNERTREGFAALFEAAGLTLAGIVCTLASFNLLIARPAGSVTILSIGLDVSIGSIAATSGGILVMAALLQVVTKRAECRS
jgi:hypothetical protein